MPRKKREQNNVTRCFSQTLKQLVGEKEKNGETQSNIAAGIGITPSMLFDYMNDYKTPAIDVLYKISSYFGVSSDYLLTGIKAENHNIAEYTGLCDESIERLHNCNEGAAKIVFMRPLTWLINSEEGFRFLSSIWSVKTFCDLMKNACKQVDDKTFNQTDKTGSRANAFQELFDKMRLCRFEVSENVSGLIEELFEYKTVEKECYEAFSELRLLEIHTMTIETEGSKDGQHDTDDNESR